MNNSQSLIVNSQSKYSARSIERLKTCHPQLQVLFLEIVREFDNTILEGHRPEHRQNQLYAEGKSKLKWPDSKHNTELSMAVDAAPWPIDWNDTARFYYFGGFVLGIAQRSGIRLRWGGDWDSDRLIKDQSFNDLVHFELLT